MNTKNIFSPSNPITGDWLEQRIKSPAFEKIYELLQSQSNPLIITGQRGSGKTSAAMAAIERQRREDPDRLIVRLSGSWQKFDDLLTEIHKEILRISNKEFKKTESNQVTISEISELIARSEKKVLIFLDDAELVEDLSEVLHKLSELTLKNDKIDLIVASTDLSALENMRDGYKFLQYAVKLSGFSRIEIEKFFDDAEQRLKSEGCSVIFTREFRDEAAKDSNGLPRYLHAIGNEAIAIVNSPKNKLPIELGLDVYAQIKDRLFSDLFTHPIPAEAVSELIDVKGEISIFLDPGDSSPEDIEEFFSALSDLHRACGGFGVAIKQEDSRVFTLTPSFA